MEQNIIEYARELSIKKLFEINGFNSVWDTWREKINKDILLSHPISANEIFSIGDHLRDIFKTTGKAGRSQSDVSAGGAVWEALVCWYLNLCLIGRRTFVLKHNRELIPEPIYKAITVNYGTFRSNTESDLIAITFPDREEYKIDKSLIRTPSLNLEDCDTSSKKYPFLPVINYLVDRDFEDIEIHIIQCKTNWNDNAQVPMLWDAVYAAENFRNDISIGTDGYSIKRAKYFSYAFVTVPSNQIEKDGVLQYRKETTAVLRVNRLSGGNYWGLPSLDNVASSVKELLSRKLGTGSDRSIITTLKEELPYLTTTYDYFKLFKTEEDEK